MKVLPGDLVSVTAGAILCPGAPVSCQWDSGDATNIVRGFVIEDLGPERVIWCSPSRYIGRDNRARVFLSLDLAADLGPTVALRWLGRHYGIDAGMTAPEWGAAGWGIWDLRARDGSHVGFTADAATAKKFSDPKRGIVHYVPSLANVTDPADALALACLAAGGRS